MKRYTRRKFIGSVFSAAAATSLAPTSLHLSVPGWKSSGPSPQIERDFEPGYLRLHRRGELRRRGEELWQLMSHCSLCPRQCGASRLAGEEGFCRATSQLVVAAFHPHYGEERSLVGRRGSGTVFFSNCNLRCVFCIN
ncbi:MAG: radical SAM protein, partial [Gemmatimonadota bacterium]